ncbi:phage holin family protein [Pseudomonas rubra]|uniref:Phage holin family protein n=1 Tax=Pseudomonas rubra TaxID=2942627 RepID=A0ABT5PCS0_9PSED|nr:phage holin family protein [Pseudomonas rubra]MDD1015981.1 phage holin family protein [Pseudomonas rubra]MDD1039248.1 phage holin family protein [Pseudomonas rubra]MDD1155218.1 phage holin family protein [Pseudomonas rubra]
MESEPLAGAGPSSKRLGAAVLGLLHGHVELFGIELQEQKARTLSLLLFAGLALVFALLLLTALSGLMLVMLWDSYRLAGIIGLCVFYAIAALFCGLRLKAAVFDESSPFSSTLEELAKDRERLLP